MEKQCELCNSERTLTEYVVQPIKENQKNVFICSNCIEQIETSKFDVNHFRCLNDSMWSENPGVQVLAYRILKKLPGEQWAEDLLDILYLEDDIKEWAESIVSEDNDNGLIHKDCNGVILSPGDTVSLIKDLNVKGASFTAKRGTAVRRISLDPYNAEHIEGRVNGQKIVILTQFVKKLK